MCLQIVLPSELAGRILDAERVPHFKRISSNDITNLYFHGRV